MISDSKMIATTAALDDHTPLGWAVDSAQ